MCVCGHVHCVFWERSSISFPGKRCWVRFVGFNYTWVPSATFFLSGAVKSPYSCDHRLGLRAGQAAHPPRRSQPRAALPGLHGAVCSPASSPSPSAAVSWVSTGKFLVLNALDSSLVVNQTAVVELSGHNTFECFSVKIQKCVCLFPPFPC